MSRKKKCKQVHNFHHYLTWFLTPKCVFAPKNIDIWIFFNKATFPIILGYVIFGFKAQEATISKKIIINIQNAIALGFTCVMLTWIKNYKHLFICGDLTTNDFIPIVQIVSFWIQIIKWYYSKHIILNKIDSLYSID